MPTASALRVAVGQTSSPEPAEASSSRPTDITQSGESCQMFIDLLSTLEEAEMKDVLEAVIGGSSQSMERIINRYPEATINTILNAPVDGVREVFGVLDEHGVAEILPSPCNPAQGSHNDDDYREAEPDNTNEEHHHLLTITNPRKSNGPAAAPWRFRLGIGPKAFAASYTSFFVLSCLYLILAGFHVKSAKTVVRNIDWSDTPMKSVIAHANYKIRTVVFQFVPPFTFAIATVHFIMVYRRANRLHFWICAALAVLSFLVWLIALGALFKGPSGFEQCESLPETPEQKKYAKCVLGILPKEDCKEFTKDPSTWRPPNLLNPCQIIHAAYEHSHARILVLCFFMSVLSLSYALIIWWPILHKA